MYRLSILLHTIFLFSSVVLRAAGHGFVHTVLIDGKEYQGWNPFSDPYNNPVPRATRKVGSDGFVAESDANLACHIGGDAGTSVLAEAPAGSKITFQWVYWPGDHQGPVSTYMASCGDDCSSFSANSAKWFKIDASGYSANDRQWAAAKLIADGASWTSTIPTNLAPGEYLIRNEIVALHSITPQFYPSCVQVRVTGSGTGRPSSDEEMTMQQVYSGASWPNIYLSNDLGSYEVPGPPPARLGGNDSTEPGTTTTTKAPSTTSTRAGTSTRTISSTPPATETPQSSAQCRLVRRRLVRRRSL
ncbi:hypothetical protein D9611_000033 [Ephemerocybe angulata]|uniref:lytic cellulose monooxygenase (C4-dehydrogenating) n=1 Tax=Ephemerocybe angulata TaxID=980116 RepID=A0A8H5BLY7_9AGAR|nr:hypothetical protein D9611_000033 [Tulosesus angulatus]